ncbi:hypothetical protein HYH02_013787 [Chlamydomonas schloesseri]|uniref:Tyrosine specific protein phosphatases domain-containing protein n=1 Tax=Chlamydomonas schloesseri TaxID=2026947 RepID=A0A835T1N5_9CHLO|nr:hypothetical protein HYH02_013787 [Chlamydomonas schloesseri]|eukprot:KAG2430310.1 hypothetical protein HYH02_013787 [Chlamydomonas schloesseri]
MSTPGPKGAQELPAPEIVISSRAGDVLIKHTTLKADHFPSCHNTKLVPIMEGAPNFRQIPNVPVYGVAIPTVTGLRSALNAVGANKGARKVYWQNLREEPLVFINGNPFVVREADQPFCNLEYTGIDRSRVEDMERRLKEDILQEAAAFGNRILVKHENEDLSLYDHWEPVTAADVQTPNEVYAELRADGYHIDYLRVPVTDEKAPKDSDFDMLIQRLWPNLGNPAFIFNCQMGRGRTTTGTIIGTLLYLRKLGAFPPGAKNMMPPQPGNGGGPGAAAAAAAAPEVPVWFPLSMQATPPVGEQTKDKLKWGMYDVVRSLLRVLENGVQGKAVLDAVIDHCSQMQNLREAIGSYRSRFLKEMRERQRASLLAVCLEYLERYYMLIAFASYLCSPHFNPDMPTQASFADWMASRPELRSILMRLLRRNSMAALDLHLPVAAPGPGGPDGAGGAPLGLPAGTTSGDVTAARSGAVLGPFTILKEDQFPGMRSHKVPQPIDGAPNFRGLPGMPIFGTGMPTIEGIVAVLRVVSGSTSPNASKRVHALWINMREEPVVYIKGRPFVLREERRPLKNMAEYAGIDAERVASMEERLKRDVLAEAQKFGGRILLAYESTAAGHVGELSDVWETISGPEDVQTSAEVYAGLTGQGFAVKYFRVPVTDGTSPAEADFESILRSILDWGLDNPVIFNCQLGIGRTTAGMVIAGLVHLYSTGSLGGASERSGSTVLAEMDEQALHKFLLEGVSPRSEAEEDVDGEHRDDEDEKEPKVWDLEPDEVELQRSLAAGGYVGVRKIERLLEEGEAAKKVVDQIIDAASDLINLRVAIMKYRKPRSSYTYMRPEMQQRHAAFKRGSAYLERYCQLIAFAYYLEHVGPETCAFGDWLASRPDLKAAFTSIHDNPGAALEPVPVAKLPSVFRHTSTQGTGGLTDDGNEADSAAADQRQVLGRRKGRTLTKRTILKSYLLPRPHKQSKAEEGGETAAAEAEVPQHVQAGPFPVFSVGNVSSAELGALLKHLGAGPDGRSHVVIADVREELVVYVNGVPYIRRELEMPAAAMHHAGVHAAQLQELEVLLKEDVTDEAALWGSRVLLHREAPHTHHHPHHPHSHAAASGSAGGAKPPATPARGVPPNGGDANGLSPAPPATPATPATPDLVAAATPGTATSTATNATAGGGATATSKPDDVTGLVDLYPGTSVEPFWEAVDPDSATALLTPLELMQQLEEAGYRLSYRRIPLSRERTPEAADVDALHAQLTQLASDAADDLRGEEAAAAAGVGGGGGAGPGIVVHLILSRTATGSSARFVAAACGTYLSRQQSGHAESAGGAPAGGPPGLPFLQSIPGGLRASLSGGSPLGSASASAASLSGGGAALGLEAAAGEYRGIMSLCRLLPGGFEAKLAVDAAVAAIAKQVGDLLKDIQNCKAQAEAPAAPPAAGANPGAALAVAPLGPQFAARQLGLHYLKRYFLLITYRCFLDHSAYKLCGFADWVAQQPELHHLANHLTLDL